MAYRDPGGTLWPSKEYYDSRPATPAATPEAQPPTEIEQIGVQIEQKQAQIAGATTAGYGVGGENEGQQIPVDILTPTITPQFTSATATDATKAISSAGNLGSMWQTILDQQTKMQEGLDKAQEQSQTMWQKLTGKETTSQADLLKDQYEEWGIPDTFKQMQDITALTLPLQQQLADLQTQETNAIAQVSQVGMSEAWQDRRSLEIQERFAKIKAPLATQLNAYAAQTQALQGNLGIAQSFANQAVNAATYDQEFEYNQMRDFMSINQNYIDNLTSSQQHLFDQALSIKRDELDYARADKTQVGNLMLEYPSAGISMSDTFDEAVAKAGRVAPATTTTTTGGIKFSSGDIGRISITGLSGQEISQIESDINEFGWNETKKGLEDDQIKAIENVLSGVTPTQAGKPTGKETALADLVSTIDDYKNDWIENGDKGAGTREAFIDKMNTVFPELNKQEIAEQVYKNANDEWLKKNKTFWGNQPGKG